MGYVSIIPVNALATSQMNGDYKAIYTFDTNKATHGKDSFPNTRQDDLDSDASGNQWQSQFMPVYAQWPLKLNADLGASYDITRIYYENSHDRGGSTQVGFRHVQIYGTNSSSAYQETRGNILDNLDLLWEGNFQKHIETTNGQILPYVSGNVADPQYITLTNHGSYRYYIFVIYNTFFNPSTRCMAYAGIRRIELQMDV